MRFLTGFNAHIAKSNRFPIESQRQNTVRDHLTGLDLCRGFKELVGLLTVAGEVRQLQVVDIARVSALFEGDYVVYRSTQRVRVFQRLVNGLAAYAANFLTCEYLLAVRIELRHLPFHKRRTLRRIHDITPGLSKPATHTKHEGRAKVKHPVFSAGCSVSILIIPHPNPPFPPTRDKIWGYLLCNLYI